MVYVKWIDPSSTSRWQSLEDAEKIQPLECETLGYVLKSGRQSILVASTRNEKRDVGDVTVLPRVCIREIRELVFKEPVLRR